MQVSCAPAVAPCAFSTHLGPLLPALPLTTHKLRWQRTPHPSSLPIGLSLVTPGDTVNTWILSCPRMRIAWEPQIQQLHYLEPTEQYQALIIYIFPVLLEIYRVPPGSARARIWAPADCLQSGLLTTVQDPWKNCHGCQELSSKIQQHQVWVRVLPCSLSPSLSFLICKIGIVTLSTLQSAKNK